MENVKVTVSDYGVNIFVDPDSDIYDNFPIDAVFTSMNHATSYFTPQYLWSFNKCHRLTIIDLSSITTSEY